MQKELSETTFFFIESLRGLITVKSTDELNDQRNQSILGSGQTANKLEQRVPPTAIVLCSKLDQYPDEAWG